MYSPKRRFRLFRNPAFAGTLQYTWTEQASSPSQPYYNIETSSDFTTQISTRQSVVDTARGPYVSTNSGATWTRKVTGITFLTNGASYTTDVALAKSSPSIMYCSNRRTFVSTLPSTYDKLYKSTDTGDNWTAISPADAVWQCIDCSYDGSVVLAGNSNSGDATYNLKLALSIDGGSTWSAVGPSAQWTRVAVSSTGTRMYALNAGTNRLYVSSDTGSTWSLATPTNVRSIACSSDGLTVLIGRGTSSTPMISTDGGTIFNAITSLPNSDWNIVAMSDNANVMAATRDSTLRIYMSTDGGVTWAEQTTSPSIAWAGMDMNSDGTKISAGGTSSKLYVGEPPI